MSNPPKDGWNERLTDALGSEPGIGLAKRASVLVAIGGPRPNAATQADALPRAARLALAGPRSGLAAGLTGGPQMALEAATDQALGGPPTTVDQVKRYRVTLLAGNAGLIAAGVLAQRMLNHSSDGAGTQVGSAAARQLTVGAAAATIILVSDTVLGPLAQRQQDSSPARMVLRTATLRGQSAALRKLAGVLTLPTKPDPFAYVS